MILPLVKEPNAILHARAIPVQEVTPEIRQLIDDMIETMYIAEGVGLAANQVGKQWDLFVASPDGKKGGELVVMNGEIVERTGCHTSAEGCLSLPGVSAEVTRADQVTVKGLDRRLKPITLQADGLVAKILQHEIDHLQGHLYVDRIGYFQRKKILSKYKTLAETLGRVKV